jgi:maltooligosyltrehalose trehalohydrolase
VGNRALGERMSALVSTRLVEISAAIVLLSPFVPMLFQGEEWGASSPFLYFTDHRDAALGAAVREGRRNEFASFGWDPQRIPDPQDPDSFLRSKLDWAERSTAPHADLLSWYRRLIALRSTYLSDDGLVVRDVHVDDVARCVVVRSSRLLWSVNFSTEAQVLSTRTAIGDLILANDMEINVEQGQICMPPQSLAIFRLS